MTQVYILIGLLLFTSVFALERVYFIAADEVQWDFAPSGRDAFTGTSFSSLNSDGQHGSGGMESMGHGEAATWVLPSSNRIGTSYKKVLYREYTDESFSTLKNRSAEWDHLGYLGPVIYASVGDTVRIVFKNNAGSGNRSYSIHAHGVFYTKENEGVTQDDSLMQIPTRSTNSTMNHTEEDHNMNSTHTPMNMTSVNGNAVAPGQNYTYIWTVPERSGPGPSDGSSIVWLYHSHVDEIRDTNSGLVGPIVVTRSSDDVKRGKPRDIEKEFITLFTIVDENLSWYLDENMQTAFPALSSTELTTLKADEDFQMSNQKHAMNGFIFANLMSMEMDKGDRVRWHTLALGDEADLHGIHWHGQTVLFDGHRTDVLELMPASAKSVDMIADNPGIWLYHCHTNHHMTAGMYTLFTVYDLSPDHQMNQHPMGDTASWKYILIFGGMSLLTAISIYGGMKLL